jgi:hypothetical protein
MAGSIKKGGPRALTTTYTTDVMAGAAGGATSGGSALVFDIVRHIHVMNKLAADTFRLYLGASVTNAAGTELYFDYPVGAKLAVDFYMATKLTSADFLVGGAATTLTLVIEIDLEEYVV